MVTSNPLLKRQDAFVGTTEDSMTLNGTVNKTGILLAICAAMGYVGWNNPELAGGVLYLALFGGLILCLVGTFMPKTTPFVAPAYAACEGLVLGVISQMFNARYPGIAATAVLATFAVLGIFLFLYVTRIVRVTRGFAIAIVAATGGVLVVYLVGLVFSLFGHPLGMLYGNGPVSILVSVVVCAIAAFNFFLDFASIESSIRNGAPRYMEWYSGMALLVTVVWLYLEILRLLSKLQSRR